MKFLSIDYGLKRTGFAICDDRQTICSPLEVFEGQGGLLDRTKKIVDEYCIDAIVIGLPLNMDGTEGSQSKIVREFAEKVGVYTNLEIHFQDERLTSREAELSMVEASLTRKKKKKRLDAVAAAKILEAFLHNFSQ